MTWTASNNAAGGTNGVTVTPANSGGASGTAFSAVTSSPKFTNTPTDNGDALAYSCSNGQSMTWTYTGGTDIYTRCYVNITAGATASVLVSRASIGGVSYAYVNLVFGSGTWKLSLLNNGGTGATGTYAMTTATWYRVEMHVHQSATVSYVEAYLFDNSGNQLDYRITAANGTATGINQIIMGQGGFAATATYSDLAGSDQGWLGGIPIPISGSDTGTGTEQPAYVIPVSSADAGTGSESSGSAAIINYASGTEAGKGQEGDTEPAASADAGTGVESAFMLGLPAGSDQGLGTEAGAVFIAVLALSDQDSGAGADAYFTSGPLADVDAGSGTDSSAVPLLIVSDAGSGAEQAAYSIEVFPYPPAWLFSSDGGYLLVWRPGTPDEREVARFGPLSRAEMAGVAETIDRMRDAGSLGFVSDSDAGGGSESSLPTATIVQFAVGTRVTCSVPS